MGSAIIGLGNIRGPRPQGRRERGLFFSTNEPTWAASMTKQRSGIHLIAQMANVSIGTVDRALHGRGGIKESTRQRILQVARQIGYTPNLAARALSVAKASARVGVCIPREIHFFYDQVWSGVLDEARRVGQLGLQFLNRPVHALGEGDTAVFKELVQCGVYGIILTAGNPKALTPLIDEAEANGIRVVCVSTDAPESRRSSIVCVEPSLNGSLAGELMGKLVPRASKVAVVAGMLTAEDHRKKTDGFSEAFPRHCTGGKIAGKGTKMKMKVSKKRSTSCAVSRTLRVST